MQVVVSQGQVVPVGSSHTVCWVGVTQVASWMQGVGQVPQVSTVVHVVSIVGRQVVSQGGGGTVQSQVMVSHVGMGGGGGQV